MIHFFIIICVSSDVLIYNVPKYNVRCKLNKSCIVSLCDKLINFISFFVSIV